MNKQDNNALNYDKILDLINKNEYDSAAIQIEQILSIDAKDGEINYLKGRLKLRQNKIQQALSCFLIASKHGVDTFTCHLNLAIIYKRLDDIQNSNLELYKALELSKNDMVVTYVSALNSLFISNKDYVGAHKVADFIIQKHSKQYESHSLKVRTFIKQKEYLSAKEYLKKIEKEFADNVMFVIDKAVVLYQNGDYKSAWDFLSSKDGMEVQPYFEIKALIASKLQYEQELLDINKKLFEVYNSNKSAIILGLYELNQQNYDNAINYFQAVQKTEDNKKYYYAAQYYNAVCLQRCNVPITTINKSVKSAVAIYEKSFGNSSVSDKIFIAQLLQECYQMLDDTMNANKYKNYVEYMKKIEIEFGESSVDF